jgi:hypothetical protein
MVFTLEHFQFLSVKIGLRARVKESGCLDRFFGEIF